MTENSLMIRAERLDDHVAIAELVGAAFESQAEVALISTLREQAKPLLSLVAERDDRVLGHIMFSPMTLPGFPQLTLMGLAPMGVLPQYRRQGIGSALVTAGLEQCRHDGVDAVFVLGHAGFYPRFGFVPASRFGIGSDYEVADEYFMVAELRAGALAAAKGVVHYHEAFAGL